MITPNDHAVDVNAVDVNAAAIHDQCPATASVATPAAPRSWRVGMWRPTNANAIMAPIIATPSIVRYAVAPPNVIRAAPAKALAIPPNLPKISAAAVPVARTFVG